MKRIALLIVIAAAASRSLGASLQDSTFLNYDSIYSKVSANQLNWRTLSQRCKMSSDDGHSQQDFQATMRMAKDSLVWLSISGALGVEGARVLMTPDSFRMINKIEGEYSVHDFGYLRNWLLFPVGFKMLQQILSGAKLTINERATLATRQDSTYVLYSEGDNLMEKIWVDTVNYTIQKILLKDKMFRQDMDITFEGYSNVSGKPYSLKRTINVNREGNSMELSIDISKVKVNEALTYPFELSDKYKRVE